MLVLGARPQIVKSAPVIFELQQSSLFDLILVHTGQHYDFEMSRLLFNELHLPEPTLNLAIGSGSHAWQTAKMMIALERSLKKFEPDLVLVPGDTNSALAAALTAVKLHVDVAHIEAGARSYDMKMPEEINRRLTDHCSRFLFAATENCRSNLLNEGINHKQICLSGDTMYDVFLKHRTEKLSPSDYALLTLHRPENVDDPAKLCEIIRAIIDFGDLPIIFVVHPRTMQSLRANHLLAKLEASHHITLVSPVGYISMLGLLKNARLILTDSGGLQKEAFWLGIPCITFRQSTEWIETVQTGANTLVAPEEVTRVARNYLEHGRFRKLPKLFGDGNASKKIVAFLGMS